MLQSVTLRRLPAATLHGRIHGGSRTWSSSGAPSKDSAATLPDVILANRLRMTRCCAQNERVVFTNKLSITTEVCELIVPEEMNALAIHNIQMMNDKAFANVRLPSYASVLHALMT